MSPPPTNIDGTEITGATIDGQEVQEITVDGATVFSALQLLGDHNWLLNEGTGTIGADSIGNLDGTLNGNTNWQAGNFRGGFALDFAGTGGDNFLFSGGNIGNNIDGSFSLGYTIQFTGSGSIFGSDGGSTSFSTVEGSQTGGPPSGTIVTLITDDNGNSCQPFPLATLNDGNLHRVWLVKSGNQLSDYEHYIDGNLVTTNFRENDVITSTSNFTDFRFGERGLDTSPNPIDGLIDNPIFAFNAISDQQVSEDFQRQPWS